MSFIQVNIKLEKHYIKSTLIQQANHSWIWLVGCDDKYYENNNGGWDYIVRN